VFTRKFGWMSVATACLVGSVAVAYAEEAADDGQLEEVIVTAQKREQSFQSLAIAAEVVTREEVAKTGVTTVQDAIRLVPGVKVQNIAGSGAGRVFIRGIGTASGDEFTQVVSNGVSMNIDGVNSTNASNMLGSMFDVERVEVLKGPQGTLYGASALGGVVNVITAKPKHEFEATAKIQFGNYKAGNVQGMINIPLGDTFAVRLTATKNKRDGYVNGPSTYTFSGPMLPFLPFPTWLQSIADDYYSTLVVVPPPEGVPAPPMGFVTVGSRGNFGAIDSQDFRARALWTPTSNLSILLSYQHTHDQGTSPTWVNPADVAAGHLVCCNLAFSPPPAATPAWYVAGLYRRSSETVSGEIAYDFGGFGTVTLIPTHNKLEDLGGSFELSPRAYRTNSARGQTQNTYELRWNSPAASKIVWVAGLYKTTSDRELGTSSNLRTPSPDLDGNPDTPEYSLYEVGRPFDTFNAFGQITYPFTEQLRVTAGARYSKNDADYAYQLYQTANPCSSPPSPACPLTDTVTFTSTTITRKSSRGSTTWTAGLEYDVTPQSMLYGRIATGFKSGGVQAPNTGVSITTPDPRILKTYKDETSIAYELGSKNRFLGNTLQVNAALFYTTWRNMQLSQIVCVVQGCAPFQDPTYVQFYNAGPSTQYGVELDSIWAATPDDRLSLSLSSMKGEYGTTGYYWSAPGPTGPINVFVNLKGHEMANTPKLAGTLGYSHIFHIGDGKLTATLEGEYSSDYETTHEWYFSGHTQPSYFRNNLSFTYEKGKVQVIAYGRNLQNKATIQSVFPFGVQAGEPRVYGGSLQVSF
jgi:iron complex outermembrane recepter protein